MLSNVEELTEDSESMLGSIAADDLIQIWA